MLCTYYPGKSIYSGDDVVSPGYKEGLGWGGDRACWGCGKLHAHSLKSYPWWSGTCVLNAGVQAKLWLQKKPELWVTAVSVVCPLGTQPPFPWVLAGTW